MRRRRCESAAQCKIKRFIVTSVENKCEGSSKNTELGIQTHTAFAKPISLPF